jgi:WD40 repeat protein
MPARPWRCSGDDECLLLAAFCHPARVNIVRDWEWNEPWAANQTAWCDARLAVSGSKDGTLRVWDLDGTQPQRVLEGHTGSVYLVALTPDVSLAVSGSDDKTLRVWNLEEGKYLAMFTCDAMGLVVRVFAEAHCGWSWAARS